MEKDIMVNKVKAIVITGYGTNCENEMAQACRLGGADQVDIAHVRPVPTAFAMPPLSVRMKRSRTSSSVSSGTAN
jgi:hypothetical protein